MLLITKSMINAYQIVLDTNVLLTGLRSNRGASYKLLTILNDRRWQLNVSTTLVFQINRPQSTRKNSPKALA